MPMFADLPHEPLSDDFGFDRGTPVDRRYIEAFLKARRRAIHGRVIEVEDNTYTTMFGADRVAESLVVDIDVRNPRATLIADLEQVGSLSRDVNDCIILTQTLHLLRRPEHCLDNCFHALRAGGVLLATAPSVSRVSPTYPDGDFWRFTPAGMAELFARHWPSDFTVHAFGSLRTCLAFLLGVVQEDLPDAVLDDHDPRFPLTVAVEAHKTSAERGVAQARRVATAGKPDTRARGTTKIVSEAKHGRRRLSRTAVLGQPATELNAWLQSGTTSTVGGRWKRFSTAPTTMRPLPSPSARPNSTCLPPPPAGPGSVNNMSAAARRMSSTSCMASNRQAPIG